MELAADIRIGGTAGDPSSVVPITRNINTTAPLTGGGNLSADRTLGITQATGGTNGYLSATDWTTFYSRMINPMSALGDIIYGGALGTPTRLATAAQNNSVLHNDGTAPYWDLITEAHLSFSNITTANANSSQHGLLPRLSNNSGQYLDGQGNWSTPAASAVTAYSSTSFTNQTSVNVTHNFGQYPVVQVIDNTGAALVPLSIVNNTVNDFTVTLASSTTGTIIATIGSPGMQAYIAVSADYAILTTDRIVKALVSGIDITLPTAVGNTGREFVIDNSSSGNITLWPQIYELIESESTQTIPYDSAIRVYSDGVNWRIY
jgi:hypothetical protein